MDGSTAYGTISSLTGKVYLPDFLRLTSPSCANLIMFDAGIGGRWIKNLNPSVLPSGRIAAWQDAVDLLFSIGEAWLRHSCRSLSTRVCPHILFKNIYTVITDV